MTATPSRRRSRLVLLLLVGVGVGAGGWFAYARGKSLFADASHSPDAKSAAVSVEVVSPQSGGIDRVCVQPGTVEPIEAADLYAKVPGFLAERTVDIGSRVKKGDVLARVAVPEHEKQLQRDTARVKAAESKVRQLQAHLVAAQSEAKAAEAGVSLSKALVRAKTAYRQYREKQLARFTDLAKQRAIEQRVVDEQEDFYLSAQEAENAAKEAVNAAAERSATAKAKIAQAEADIEQARAEVGVAEAERERSQVMVDYAVIRAPFNGVVTHRDLKNSDVGAFVKSADASGAVPLLSVARIDVMRVVMQVPDRDVPFVSLGDQAGLRIDALPDAAFKTFGVSRWSRSEDPATRTMRVEIDVPNPTDAKNPEGILAPGMYGRATLILQSGAPTAVRIPTTAVANRTGPGQGIVRVVRDGRIRSLPVKFGADNGVEIEVLAGLTVDDRVVVRASGAAEDGTAVAIAGAKADSGH